MKQALVSYLVITSIFASASGTEFQVNTRTSRNQANAAVATDELGNFVVVWSSWFVSKSNEIRGRRFAADGSPIDANEFEINTIEAGNQKEPSVAMDDVGNFVVTWQGPGQDQNDIFAQRFDANGQKIDSEFRVNSNIADEQLCPSVAMNDSGNFVVVWESYNVPEIGKQAICAQSYDSLGQPLGNEIRVDDINSVCRYPDVALTNSGLAIVVWLKDSSTKEVYRRSFQADGTLPVYNSLKVSDSPNFTSLTRPSISVDSMGNYAIAWDGHPQDYEKDDIYVVPFHYTGAPWPSQFLVNSTTTGAQRNPAVVMLDDGGHFVVLWEGDSPQAGFQRDVFGQRLIVKFDWPSELSKVGDEFKLNTYIVNEQRYPTAAMISGGRLVCCWQSHGQDGSGYGIFGEFGPKICCADFTGDGFVNFRDYCVLAEEWLKVENPLRADLVDDNKIDRCDLNAFCDQWLSSCYDCNDVDIYNDGQIDFKDYSLLTGSWLNQGPFDADITGNGTVDLADLKALTLHWAKTCEQ